MLRKVSEHSLIHFYFFYRHTGFLFGEGADFNLQIITRIHSINKENSECAGLDSNPGHSL